jgi:hypothetical protein
LVLLVTLLSWYGAVQQLVLKKPFGTNPAPDSLMLVIWIVFGVGFPYFFGSLRLVTEVHTDRICIRFFPLHRRFICFEFSDILEYKTITYRPIREFGGWGIRSGPNGKAYNVQGNHGVELVLKNQSRILIGSQQAEQVVAALDAGYPK